MSKDPLRSALDFCATEGISYYCAIGPRPKLHSHEWIELAYLEHGSLMHSVGGISYMVNEGDYFIVEYGQPHDYVTMSDEPLRLLNIMFHPRFIDSTLTDAHSLKEVFNHYLIHFNAAQLTVTPTLNKFTDATGAIYRYVKDIVAEIAEKKFGWRESVRGILIHIIIQTLRGITYAEHSMDDTAFSRKIIDFVNANYMRPIKISDAFESGQYSTPYLSKRFKKETGITFSDFLKRTRLETSRRLLINTDKSVAEVAELVGYVDTTFFHNAFRSSMGCTPLEYRKSRIEERLSLTIYGENEGRRYSVEQQNKSDE